MAEHPICNACEEYITDRRCIVMNAEEQFDTCFCFRCKNKMIKAVSNISKYGAEIFRDYLEENERRTPTKNLDETT
jgi:hypothetical protein